MTKTNQPDNQPFVVTIGRQFGSGGRVIGKKLAERLGIKFYDKELLAEAARRSGVGLEFFEKHDERQPSMFSGMFSFAMGTVPMGYYAGTSSISNDGIYRAYTELINTLAQQESCVIVGRTSDYILRDNPRCVNVFIHAPAEKCIDRIVEREDAPRLDRRQAQAMMNRINKIRSGYYNFYTDKTWGDSASYHLSVDSSALSDDETVELIIDYLKRRGFVDKSI